MEQNLKHNIPLLYIYSIFIKRVSQPIIILYFLLNTLNFTQIGILAAVTAIIQLTTEIPGGVFADSHGKKKSLILHSIFGILTMFFYFIGNSFEIFLIASIMYGLGGAFITGTRPAFLYDTLLKLKKEKEFKKYNSKVLLYSHSINAIFLLIIPVIYVFNSKLPFLIGIFCFGISLLAALLMTEPEIRKEKIPISKYNKKIIETIKEIWENKKLLPFFMLAMITSAYVYICSDFIQPLLQISGLEIIYFGVIYALMRALTGLGGLIIDRLEKYFLSEKLTNLIIIGFGLTLFAFYSGTGILIILAIFLFNLLEGANRIILEDDINKYIKSENRTTILSISSLSKEVLYAILILFFGIMADIQGVQNMFLYAIIVFAFLILLTKIFAKKIKKYF